MTLGWAGEPAAPPDGDMGDPSYSEKPRLHYAVSECPGRHGDKRGRHFAGKEGGLRGGDGIRSLEVFWLGNWVCQVPHPGGPPAPELSHAPRNPCMKPSVHSVSLGLSSGH